MFRYSGEVVINDKVVNLVAEFDQEINTKPSIICLDGKGFDHYPITQINTWCKL